MRNKLIQHSVGAATTALLLTAPAVAGGDPVEPIVGGENVRVHGVLVQGEGSGTISIPTVTSEGQLVGVMADQGSFDRYIVQATLTSFLPAASSDVATTTGGVYGKLLQIDASGEVLEQKALYLDGTWELDTGTSGTITASLLSNPRLGSPQLIGRIEGKFAVGTEDQPGSAAFSAAAPDGKRRTRDFQSARDVRGGKGGAPFQSARDARGDKQRTNPWQSAREESGAEDDPFQSARDARGDKQRTNPWQSAREESGGEDDPFQSARDELGDGKHRDDPFRSAREAAGKRKFQGGALDDARSEGGDGILFTAPIAMQFVLVQ